MMNIFVDRENVDEWMKEHTNAGYSDPDIFLTQADVDQLKAGKVLVQAGEYGTAIYWEDREYNANTS